MSVAVLAGSQLPAILNVEADRPEIVLIHAAVHGKAQRLAFAFEVRGECRKGLVWLAVVTAPVDTQVVLSWVEAANDVGRALEDLLRQDSAWAVPYATRQSRVSTNS